MKKITLNLNNYLNNFIYFKKRLIQYVNMEFCINNIEKEVTNYMPKRTMLAKPKGKITDPKKGIND